MNNCIRRVHTEVWGGRPVEKENFLMGRNMGCLEATLMYMLSNMIIKHRIWMYKLAGVLPREDKIIEDLRVWLRGLVWHNKWRIMLPLVQRQLNM